MVGKHRHMPREYGPEPRTWKPEPEHYVTASKWRDLARACGVGRAEICAAQIVGRATLADQMRGRRPIPPRQWLDLQSWLRATHTREYAEFFGIDP